MPKIKTSRSARKRFRVTGTGKIKFKHAYKSHILTKKKSKRIRHLRKGDYLRSTESKRVKRLLGI